MDSSTKLIQSGHGQVPEAWLGLINTRLGCQHKRHRGGPVEGTIRWHNLRGDPAGFPCRTDDLAIIRGGTGQHHSLVRLVPAVGTPRANTASGYRGVSRPASRPGFPKPLWDRRSEAVQPTPGYLRVQQASVSRTSAPAGRVIRLLLRSCSPAAGGQRWLD